MSEESAQSPALQRSYKTIRGPADLELVAVDGAAQDLGNAGVNFLSSFGLQEQCSTPDQGRLHCLPERSCLLNAQPACQRQHRSSGIGSYFKWHGVFLTQHSLLSTLIVSVVKTEMGPNIAFHAEGLCGTQGGASFPDFGDDIPRIRRTFSISGNGSDGFTM